MTLCSFGLALLSYWQGPISLIYLSLLGVGISRAFSAPTRWALVEALPLMWRLHVPGTGAMISKDSSPSRGAAPNAIPRNALVSVAVIEVPLGSRTDRCASVENSVNLPRDGAGIATLLSNVAPAGIAPVIAGAV